MEEKENSGSLRRRRYGSQPVSVPFLWEEKPGTPKKEWTMPKAAPLVTAPSPVRLIVSVPFQWEEKPGKPLSSLSRLSPDPGSASFIPPLAASLSSSNPFIGETEGQLFQESSREHSSNHHESWYTINNARGQDGEADPAAAYYPELLPKKGDRSLMVKRTLTLAELILLSRKLSYRRKPTDIKKQRFSMVHSFKLKLCCF